MSNEFKIEISGAKIEFDAHLALQNNKRILFSGCFGSGKTYFLNDFFEEKKEDYFVIKLNPIRYSVSPNEDIFSLVKYDIIRKIDEYCGYELFNILKEVAKKEISTPNLIYTKTQNVFQSIFKHISLFSQAVEVSAGGVGTILGKGVHDSIKTVVDEVTEKNQYLMQSFQGQKKAHELYQETKNHYTNQNDAISIFINAILDFMFKQKTEETTETQNISKSKKTVLIVDDLDRLYPEQIFRLLNIFACHIHLDDENQFGFDHVIFCCDVENIRKIFLAKYGQNIDFSGYIDKFYSKNIFYYDVRDNIVAFLAEHFRTYEDYEECEKTLLKPLIFADVLNIRLLEKGGLFIKDIRNLNTFLPRKINSREGFNCLYSQINNTSLQREIVYFRSFCPSINDFLSVIEKLQMPNDIDTFEYFFNQLAFPAFISYAYLFQSESIFNVVDSGNKQNIETQQFYENIEFYVKITQYTNVREREKYYVCKSRFNSNSNTYPKNPERSRIMKKLISDFVKVLVEYKILT